MDRVLTMSYVQPMIITENVFSNSTQTPVRSQDPDKLVSEVRLRSFFVNLEDREDKT